MDLAFDGKCTEMSHQLGGNIGSFDTRKDELPHRREKTRRYPLLPPNTRVANNEEATATVIIWHSEIKTSEELLKLVARQGCC